MIEFLVDEKEQYILLGRCNTNRPLEPFATEWSEQAAWWLAFQVWLVVDYSHSSFRIEPYLPVSAKTILLHQRAFETRCHVNFWIADEAGEFIVKQPTPKQARAAVDKFEYEGETAWYLAAIAGWIRSLVNANSLKLASSELDPRFKRFKTACESSAETAAGNRENEGFGNSGTATAPPDDIPLAVRRAGESLEKVEVERPDLSPPANNRVRYDKRQWSYIRDHYDEIYPPDASGRTTMPAFQTWGRYVREYLRLTEGPRNSPRTGRPHGRSIVEQKDLDKSRHDADD